MQRKQENEFVLRDMHRWINIMSTYQLSHDHEIREKYLKYKISQFLSYLMLKEYRKNNPRYQSRPS